MKKITSLFIVSIILLPMLSFAQSTPQAPASWVAFQKQENAKRLAFFQEMKADREAFFNANPDVKAYFAQMQASAKARIAAWRASHPSKNFGNSAFTQPSAL